ncbi:hypothetical protein ZHAS_00004199 [Anopheles sinensis]|uniref:Uncharacterized protein n=1 Tax=Anopheles sinensis TaxID=74873 RepID=A0A084VGC1_ANOSI|nr:hypothetical protein ZHAS_00004199 [Anopheles sinensis]
MAVVGDVENNGKAGVQGEADGVKLPLGGWVESLKLPPVVNLAAPDGKKRAAQGGGEDVMSLNYGAIDI